MDDRTDRLVSRARAVIPGGAQTGLRAQAYDLGDVAFEAADGATLATVAGETLTDYHLAFGPILLGHGREEVDTAAKEAIDRGVLYGAATTDLEVEVAERLVDLLPSVEMVNFCNSGSEATYHAIRLARAHTGNEKLLKFEGCYHGWHDYVDVSVYPPAEEVAGRNTGGDASPELDPYPESDGMLSAAVDSTVVVPFNDPEAFRAAMERHGDDLAGVILEPVPHSVGCLRPTDAFLDALEAETDARDVPLVFDEVITGFRHSANGMQAELGVDPDLTCVAKAMGNGYPVAAVGGRADLLAQAGGDNESGVVISGTYSGSPMGLAAARETLGLVESEDVPARVGDLGDRYRAGLRDLLADRGIEGRVVGYGSIFSVQFGVTGRPRDYADVAGLDEERFREFAAGMRERGHFFTPNPYKRHHLSLAHTDDHLDAYLDDADEVLSGLSA
ncbi:MULTISPECIES: aspartate aminotransferase family protein [Halorussus]|uniref:aspartate aminotransferase family protein n=1 Tax=Halorussus TaxID=1070314 RepID=UPI000E20CE45|nr:MULTISPECIES: aspartate aminotransferase family protein [Halorussus]NHN60869.1 aspartate aminotransferase family protein [Halorussus sp. JP-T4]